MHVLLFSNKNSKKGHEKERSSSEGCLVLSFMVYTFYLAKFLQSSVYACTQTQVLRVYEKVRNIVL